MKQSLLKKTETLIFHVVFMSVFKTVKYLELLDSFYFLFLLCFLSAAKVQLPNLGSIKFNIV